jgi:hypothetical protein
MLPCRKTWLCVAVGCVFAAAWLAIEISNPKLNAQVNSPTLPKASVLPANDAVAALQSRVEKLEKELQTLKSYGFFAGLSRPRTDSSKPDPNEIAILRKLVEARVVTWQKLDAWRNLGMPGGDAASEAQARFQLYMAFAQLACAEHQVNETREYLRQAAKAAETQVEAMTAAYETGRIVLDPLMSAQQDLAKANLLYYWAGGKMPVVKLDYPWAPAGLLPKPAPIEEK